jgi:peptide chain release factor 3
MLQSYQREGDYIYAAVGQLQFEVMQYRLKDEYGVETVLTPLPYQCSAWIKGDLKTFVKPPDAILVQDRLGHPMALFTTAWEKQYSIRQNPNNEHVDVFV